MRLFYINYNLIDEQRSCFITSGLSYRSSNAGLSAIRAKSKKEVNLWQKVIILSVGGVSLPSVLKVMRKKGK